MNIWTQLAAYSCFETERLFLRPFLYSDAADFYTISSNPDNLPFIFPAQTSLEECQYVLAICDKETGRVIGSIKFEKLDEIKKEAELGYFLHKDYWGKGLMTEVVKEITFLSFQEFHLKQVRIITHVENIASQQVALHAGYSLKRQFKGSDRYTRKMRDYYEFCIDRGDLNE